VRLLYFTNRYPAVSHTFIRREIVGLEAQGVTVERVALRADPIDALPDPLDRTEHARTRLLLGGGKARLMARILGGVARRPLVALKVLLFAIALARRSGLGIAKMLGYWAEAVLLADLGRALGTNLLRVHFGTNGAVVARLARRLGGPPYSIAYHGPDEFDAPERWDLRGTIAEAACVTAISHYCAAQLMRWSDPLHWDRIGVVHCLVDGDLFALTPLPDGPLRLCTVARLAPQKGLPLLLDALAGLGDPPELVVVGGGPARAALEAQAAALGLADIVRFTGPLSGEDVRATLMQSHAFILPSFAEGLPVVIMEAMAVGRPIIATAIAGVPELVEDGKTGWLVSAGDRNALVDAIGALRSTPRESLSAIGAAGAARVRARHLANIEIPKLIEFLSDSLSKALDRNVS
jgi:glycosyltransferase involved in cell wall biosynthesis